VNEAFPRDVTVVIPHIPVRPNALARAVRSVALQSHKVTDIIIATDTHKVGAALTRNRALHNVSTNWVAFLDDDDVFLTNHVETLLRHAEATGATVTYSGCRVIGSDGQEVLPRRSEWGRFGEAFDADLLRERSYIPVTSLVWTKHAKQALFGAPPGSHYDDWGFYLRLLDLGARFSHVPEVTWVWNHNGKNTSGLPDRW
jgi:glycosyltransferase involved in cell wall biosynthesis